MQEPKVTSTLRPFSPVRITRRSIGDVVVLECTGRITLGEGSDCFRDMIDIVVFGRRFKPGERIKTSPLRGKAINLLINLRDVSYIDSSGIGELVAGFETVTNLGGQMKILGLTERVRDLFQITSLYTVFEIFEDETQAVRSFL